MKVETYRGAWKDIGFALGKQQASDIRRIVRLGRTTPVLRKLVSDQGTFLRHAAPDQWDCLVGMASGAGIDPGLLVAVHSWEYDYLGSTDPERERCTTALVADEKGRHVVVHNEDEDVGWRGHIGFVRLVPTKATPILAFQYRGMLPGAGIGVNGAGIGIAMDNIWRMRRRPRVGLPPTVLGLLFLTSKNPNDPPRVFRNARTNAGCHFLLSYAERAWAFESFHDVKERCSVRPGYAHANHAIFEKTGPGSYASRNSLRRHAAMKEAVRDDPSLERALRCLRQPIDRGGAFRPRRLGRDVTLMTIQAVPTQRRLRIWTAQGWKNETV